MFGQSVDYINMWHLLPLADPGPELPLQLLSPKRSAKVFHLALCAGLDQVVEIFTAVSPSPSDETQQVSKALEPCHKCARLARCCAPHLLVQPLQRAAICPWQFSCSTVSLLFRSPRRITRDPGGHHFYFAKSVPHSVRSWDSEQEIWSQADPLAAELEITPLLK